MNTLEKEFVPYKQALALKELGFDEPCFGLFIRNKSLLVKEMPNQNECEIYFGGILAPTFPQAFRWFRDRHQLSGTSQYFKGGYHCYTINDMKDTQESNRLFTEFENYEEAELACLIKLIEIAKENKQ